MKLIKPSFEILTPIDSEAILKAIEVAGRTCYKSENLITSDSSRKFIADIINRGHESVLEHQSISVRFICDRGVSHELVRHRIASFSQESTRYCNYSKDKFDNQLTFIVPFWLENEQGSPVSGVSIWYKLMEDAEIYYNLLVNLHGWQPQQARSILPNSLKTEIVVTANLREWRTIFRQRTAPAAHPQMRELMVPLLKEFRTRIDVIFDDI